MLLRTLTTRKFAVSVSSSTGRNTKCLRCIFRATMSQGYVSTRPLSTSVIVTFPRVRRSQARPAASSKNKDDWGPEFLAAIAPAAEQSADWDSVKVFNPPAERPPKTAIQKQQSTEPAAVRPIAVAPNENEKVERKKQAKPSSPVPPVSFQTPVTPTKLKNAYRWDVEPPTGQQLSRAGDLFTKFPPLFHSSAAEFSKMKDTGMPEVAFLGRSNVGKSSLLNDIMDKPGLARTSANPGHTRMMNMYSVGNGRIALLDMPGYGHNSRPEWGEEIMKYLRGRRQLRRTFVLIDSLHGIKDTDRMILEALSRGAISYQIILSKCDRIRLSDKGKPESSALAPSNELIPGRNEGGNKKSTMKNTKDKKDKSVNLFDVFDDIRDYMESLRGVAGFGEILATAVKTKKKQSAQFGRDDVRMAILRATGLEDKVS